MNEHNWFAATDPRVLIDYLYPLRGLDSVEKQSRMSRLYLLECARRAWNRLPGVCQTVVALTENVYLKRVPDRKLRDEIYPLAEALANCRGEAEEVNSIGRRLVALNYATPVSVRVERDFDPELWVGYSQLAYLPYSRKTPHIGLIPVDVHSVELVHEVFGNPFVHHPKFQGSWRTQTVLHLASHARATMDFSALPVLADALEEAGCDRWDVLDHLRQRGPHARGCWALDLVLE